VDFFFPALKDCCEERRSYNKRHERKNEKKGKEHITGVDIRFIAACTGV